MAHPLQRVFVGLAPRNIASVGGALYLNLFKDDATRMGWLYPLRSKRAADVTSATKTFLSDVGDGVKCFGTDNGTEFINETFARLRSDEKIRHERTGVNGSKHNEVVARGLGLIQEGGMAACFEAPRLFPGQLPYLDRYWLEAAVYMNDCINTTATPENPHFKSPYEMSFGKIPPANTIAFMQPGFRRIHRTQTSDPKAEQRFYLTRGRNHSRDCVKVVTSSGQTSNTRDFTWEVKRMPIIAVEPNVGAATRPETWDCLLYTSPSPRDQRGSRMPSSA